MQPARLFEKGRSLSGESAAFMVIGDRQPLCTRICRCWSTASSTMNADRLRRYVSVSLYKQSCYEALNTFSKVKG